MRDLFRQQRDRIDGILVTLPNFGDERAVANTLRMADLHVPVLVHAFPDDPAAMGPGERRDSFCGKISVCNNLQQYDIPFTLTDQHTVDPASEDFAADLRQFAAVCRVVRGLRRMRIGMLGARTTAFNTVRFSEKLLERQGISVETLDLSEAFGQIDRLGDDDPEVLAKQQSIAGYVDTREIPGTSLAKLAKLGVVMDRWMTASALDATAVQCWTAIQEYFGVAPCTVMSMASNGLMPSACETDVAGTVSMYALALASGEPSALVDWNNNYGSDPEKAVVFHCSNLPKKVFVDVMPRMQRMAVHSPTIPDERTAGTISDGCGRIRSPTCAWQRMTCTGRFAPTWEKASSPRISLYLRRLRRRAGAAFAGTHALHLQARLRASRRGEPDEGRGRGQRGAEHLSGVVGVSPCVMPQLTRVAGSKTIYIRDT